MQGNRSRDTKPELAVRSAVHRRGVRFRVSVRPEPELPRTADLVLRKSRVAVFVDGCYWHGCPEHRTQPATNPEYWADKIARNIERDAETTDYLQQAGWMVLRFWEHEDPESVADRVQESVRAALRTRRTLESPTARRRASPALGPRTHDAAVKASETRRTRFSGDVGSASGPFTCSIQRALRAGRVVRSAEAC